MTLTSRLRSACKTVGISKGECDELADMISDVCGVKTRKKRAPSKYNVFMGKCVKERPKGTVVQTAFKNCAADYREQKKQGKI